MGLPQVNTQTIELTFPTDSSRPPPPPQPEIDENHTVFLEDFVAIEMTSEDSGVSDVEVMIGDQSRKTATEPAVWRAESAEVLSGIRRAEARSGETSVQTGSGRHGRITTLHFISAGLALIALGAILALVLRDEPKPEGFVADDKSQAAPVDMTPKDDSPPPQNPKQAESESPETPPAVAVVEPPKCLPFAKYPAFPWHDELATMLTTVMTSGVCGLLGRDAKSISEQMGALSAQPLTGYDLLPDGQVLEFFPIAGTSRPGPSLELIFAADGLLELRFDYGDRAGMSLDSTAWAKALGAPKTRVDDQGRKVERFVDGDVVIELLEKRDKYRRVFRELRFSSQPMSKSLGRILEARQKVEDALARGRELRGERRFDEARKSFEKAQNLAPDAGQARVWLGMLALPEERFEEVEQQANAAFKTSRDRRVQAEAKGLLAVVSLYNGQVDEARARFGDAATMDPANGELLQSVRELQSKTYAPERVAKTAARLECMAKAKEKAKKKRGMSKLPPWTEKGLLARGNFPDRAAYDKALSPALNKSEFKNAKKMWASWECR